MISTILFLWILIQMSAPAWTFVLLAVGLMLQLIVWKHKGEIGAE